MKPTVFLICLCVWWGVALCGRADDEITPDFQGRIERLERELNALKQAVGDGKKTPASDQSVLLLMENGVLTPLQAGDSASDWMFVMKLAAANLSSEPQEVERKDLTLVLDGKSYPLADVPEERKNTAFPWGMEYNHLNRVSPFLTLRIPPNGSSSGWVYVPGLPSGTSPSVLELVWEDGGKARKLDLLAAARSRLDLTVERIGPRQCLGLLTIRGELNSLGSGILVRELETLASERISRAVIAWEPTASQLDPMTSNWLLNSSQFEDRSQFDNHVFPVIPTAIQELHLASIPAVDFQPYNRMEERPGRKSKMHTGVVEAVRVALQEILERAPREELLALIRSENRLDRASALACGAGRLLSEDLPLVLQAADSGDVVVQEGALRGLQHFGEPEAVEKLIFWLRKETEPLSSVAAVSLASSRFPLGQERLLEQLRHESVESQARIFEELIRHPRPLLAEPLFQFVSAHPEQIRPEHLQGLETVGHPRIVELLQRGLKSSIPEVQNESMRILVARNNTECDEIAAAWSLEQLRSGPPSEQMLTILKRVKSREAVDPLLRHLSTGGDQASIIAAVGLIADPSVAGRLLELYPGLTPSSQAELLMIFRNWEIPEFKDLAKQALASEEPGKVRNAALGLIAGGGSEGLSWIGERLEQTKQPEIVQILTEVIAGLGNEQSRSIFRKIRDMDSEVHREAGVRGLEAIRKRSPGYGLYEQGLGILGEDPQNQNLTQAIEYFTQAIELDPELFEAYRARANCHLRTGKLKEAGPDFRKAMEIEPYSSDALTGYCVFLAAEGEWEEALRRLEKADPLFQSITDYQYNSACVLGRVVAYLKQHPEIPEREELLKKYSSEAFKRLRTSLDGGFDDVEHLKKDPDLESLRESEEFQKLLEKKPEAPLDAPSV